MLAMLAVCLLVTAGCSRPPAAVGDGGPDSVGCTDPEGDEDEDGISNIEEGCPLRDTDGDSVPDWEDFDSDDDGIYDSTEAGQKGAGGKCEATHGPWPCDSDSDGVPDYLDGDSDNDGLSDRDEDTNGDGLLGCCVAKCNSPGPTQSWCVLTAEGCGSGQKCAGGACSPAVAFDCSEGETNPTKKDTFGDGKPDSTRGTFVCRTSTSANAQGHKPTQWQKSFQGDWALALGKAAKYGELKVAGAGAKEAAAVIDEDDDSQIQVAGFVISHDTKDDVQDEHADILKAIVATPPVGTGTVSIRAPGVLVKSHDLYDAVQGTILDLTLSSLSDVSTVRNELIAALLGRVTADLGNLPGLSSSIHTDFVIRFVTVKRFAFKVDAMGNTVKDSQGFPVDSGDKTKWRLLVTGAVAGKAGYDDPMGTTYSAVNDLSNGTGLARANMNYSCECDARTLAGASTVVSLDRMPISTSISVVLDGKVIPRSRAAGFDYDEVARSVVLSGMTIGPGSQLLVSYKAWSALLLIPPC